MTALRRLLFAAACLFSAAAVFAFPGESLPLLWRTWSPEVFAEAKRDHKFVLLDLEAVWCHVMDTTTYRVPRS